MPEPVDHGRSLTAAAARWGALGAASACLAVAAGAFAAHALASRLAPDRVAVFETAARYQLFHALALLSVTWALERAPRAVFHWAARAFVAGSVLFCGSLYALALTGHRWLGAVTPLGGLAFLAGWILLALGLWRARRT